MNFCGFSVYMVCMCAHGKKGILVSKIMKPTKTFVWKLHTLSCSLYLYMYMYVAVMYNFYIIILHACTCRELHVATVQLALAS